jgi:hypothetical protein
VEKCAKLWRQVPGSAARRQALSEIDAAGGETNTKTEMRACSACAGDYEDPDRTAWTADETDAEEREEPRNKTTEDFPAEEG